MYLEREEEEWACTDVHVEQAMMRVQWVEICYQWSQF